MSSTFCFLSFIASIFLIQLSHSAAITPSPGLEQLSDPKPTSNEIGTLDQDQEEFPEVVETSTFNFGKWLHSIMNNYKEQERQERSVFQPAYYDEEMNDPQPVIKRYQRLGRGRIGGTIVMGKRK